MKTLNKMLLAGLLCCATFVATAQPPRHEGRPDAVSGATTPAERPDSQLQQGCMMPGAPVDFQSVKICFAPQMGAFIAVDSVECAVHIVKWDGDRLDTTASYKTDDTHKRHDLKNILRPVSVGMMGPYVVVLASAVNDSAYVALLDGNLNVMARRDFRSPMYAMHMAPGNMFVVGRNPYGYDINIIPMKCPGDLESFANGDMLTHHYRVAKQAEKIKQSDPIGIGLTAVAVGVVFLALVCIALLISGSGKLIANAEEKNKNKASKSKESKGGIKPVSKGSSSEDEIVAAIGTAIFLFNEELHDEEETVITIQKVEREWTPWNAKFYNMNQYFNNRR